MPKGNGYPKENIKKCETIQRIADILKISIFTIHFITNTLRYNSGFRVIESNIFSHLIKTQSPTYTLRTFSATFVQRNNILC